MHASHALAHLLRAAAIVSMLGTAACSSGAASEPDAELPDTSFLPLRTEGRRILDVRGREVFLRGIQHHQFQDVFYGGRDVLPEEYPRIASWGFTVLRMAFSWSRVEPTRGTYDADYVAELRAALDHAHAAGLTVLLEYQQDEYGRCAVDPSSTRFGSANGAPSWACIVPEGTPLNSTTASDSLWANQDGLFDAFVAMWTHLITTLRDHPAILGYDLYNEPFGSGDDFETAVLYPMYRKLVPMVRPLDPDRIFMVESSRAHIFGREITAEPLDDLGENVVFQVHMYTNWIGHFLGNQRIDDEARERDFGDVVAKAEVIGLPIWNGEWSINQLVEGALDDLTRFREIEEEHLLGSSFWSFSRRVSGIGPGSNSGAVVLLEEDRSPRFDVIDRLSRAYPVLTPGKLESLAVERETNVMRARFEVDATIDAPLVLYVPARTYGSDPGVDVEGPAKASVRSWPDRQRVEVTFARSGTYEVTVHPSTSAL